jgi:hypothetical protein
MSTAMSRSCIERDELVRPAAEHVDDLGEAAQLRRLGAIGAPRCDPRLISRAAYEACAPASSRRTARSCTVTLVANLARIPVGFWIQAAEGDGLAAGAITCPCVDPFL